MSEISKITEALTVVERIDELVFAESRMMRDRKTDLEDMNAEIADATTQHDDISKDIKATNEYMKKLRQLMLDAELSDKNELVAVEQTEKLERESLDVIADLEGAQGFLKLALTMLGDAADKADSMSEHAKELLEQIKIVMNRS